MNSMNRKVSSPERFRTRQGRIEDSISGWMTDELRVTPTEIRVTRLDSEQGELRIESQYRHPDTGGWRKLVTLSLKWRTTDDQESYEAGGLS